VQLRHTPYDYARAAERIRGTRYQQADEFAWIVLNPPAESEVLAAFRGMEIR
jgi:hypothetical protein